MSRQEGFISSENEGQVLFGACLFFGLYIFKNVGYNG